jgi:hypothetical protein
VGDSQVAIIQASLGGMDDVKPNHFLFTDENFPPRKSLTPRMQAKIPKMFGWQLVPGYESYLWLDGNLELKPEGLKYLTEELKGHDMVVLRHPTRPNIRQEVRYTRKGINQESLYMLQRYQNEFLKEMYEIVQQDKDYVDDLLVIGGIFLYRNTKEVQQMMKEWWYYVTRYIVQDQISFAYVLKKSGIKYKVLDDDFNNSNWMSIKGHMKRT